MMEDDTAAIIEAEIPGASVTKSNEIGRIGLLEREHAAILNARLRDLARSTVKAFRRSISDLGITAPLYLTQNDGTLMSADFAEQYPVLSFASGPTNSMRGAAFLTGLKDALVVDIGGTTSDVGALKGGFPRPANAVVQIGGGRTLFRMPDLLSIGLGGGSVVAQGADGSITIGPRSVGFRLPELARIFGGPELTSSDIAVAANQLQLGDAARVAGLDRGLVKAALTRA